MIFSYTERQSWRGGYIYAEFQLPSANLEELTYAERQGYRGRRNLRFRRTVGQHTGMIK